MITEANIKALDTDDCMLHLRFRAVVGDKVYRQGMRIEKDDDAKRISFKLRMWGSALETWIKQMEDKSIGE